MQIIENITAARAQVGSCKAKGKTVAFVPTMGNLHQGHFELIEMAKSHADVSVVSIFVNPAQFGLNEDFASYPRTLDADIDRLKTQEVDMLFVPDRAEIYPNGANSTTKILVPTVANILEGYFRPGFFEGVTSIVCKLFNILSADIAVFGKKDYQQLNVISRMVADLNIPIKVIAGDTVREKDGLAMSSRNSYLTSDERDIAPNLYQVLLSAREKLLQDGDIKEIETQAVTRLKNLGFKVDYFTIRDAINLHTFDVPSKSIILVAASLGRTRLIDNMEIGKASDTEASHKM